MAVFRVRFRLHSGTCRTVEDVEVRTRFRGWPVFDEALEILCRRLADQKLRLADKERGKAAEVDLFRDDPWEIVTACWIDDMTIDEPEP